MLLRCYCKQFRDVTQRYARLSQLTKEIFDARAAHCIGKLVRAVHTLASVSTMPLGTKNGLRTKDIVATSREHVHQLQSAATASAVLPFSCDCTFSHGMSFRSSTKIEYNTGTSNSVTKVAIARPPICA